MKDNQHTQAIPSAVLDQALTKIQEIQPLFAPYMLALPPEERRELPKMGAKTINFMEKSYDFAGAKPVW
jgi:hypothetical protein